MSTTANKFWPSNQGLVVLLMRLATYMLDMGLFFANSFMVFIKCTLQIHGIPTVLHTKKKYNSNKMSQVKYWSKNKGGNVFRSQYDLILGQNL